MSYSSPEAVLLAIAQACGCELCEIEATLESLNAPRAIPRKVDVEDRLEAIRAWLGVSEGGSTVEHATHYVRRNRVA